MWATTTLLYAINSYYFLRLRLMGSFQGLLTEIDVKLRDECLNFGVDFED